MIMGTSGRYSSGSTHDHEKGQLPSRMVRQKGEAARAVQSVWQTDGVTFGRIIIGWRVGT
jgi:hypothetical protein